MDYPQIESVTSNINSYSFSVAVNGLTNRLGLAILVHKDRTDAFPRTFSDFQLNGVSMTEVIKRESSYSSIIHSIYVYAIWHDDLPVAGNYTLQCTPSILSTYNMSFAYFDLSNVDQGAKIIDTHDEAVGFSSSGSTDYVHSLTADRDYSLAIGAAGSQNAVSWSAESGVVQSYNPVVYSPFEVIGGYKECDAGVNSVGWTASAGTRGASGWVMVQAPRKLVQTIYI